MSCYGFVHHPVGKEAADVPLYSRPALEPNRIARPLARLFAQAPGLPFTDVLSPEHVQAAFKAGGVAGIDCSYTPLATVRMLLAQALNSDPSLGQGVSRLVAERAAAGLGPLSAAWMDEADLSATAGRGGPFVS